MNSKKHFILGTRGSALALRQTQLFREELQAAHPDLSFECKSFQTTGDRIQDRFLSEIGGKGLFTKELENALAASEIDLAVHSLKDVPAELDPAFALACFPQRRAPWDALLSTKKLRLEELAPGAVVGTSSLRRRYQLHAIRPDLQFKMLRGNIDTRLKKLLTGEFDAIVLAEAGLRRLGIGLEYAQSLVTVPAPGQGCLAIETRGDDSATREMLQALHSPDTAAEVAIERKIMRALGGDCDLPLGVLAQILEGEIRIEVFLASPQGEKYLELAQSGPREEAPAVADALLAELKAKGAFEFSASSPAS